MGNLFFFPRPVAKLHSHIGVVATASVECHFCGEKADVDIEDNDTSQGAALYLYTKGWREVTSRKFQVVCAACPTCAASKDSERGQC